MSENKSTSTEKMLYCSFCGKSQNEVKKLIAGPSVYICDECIDLCNDIIREELLSSGQDKENGSRIADTQRNLQFAGSVCYLLGQEQAKKILSVAVYNHYKTPEILWRKKR